MRTAPSDRFVALAAGAAALCGIGVLVATLQPWYAVASAVRPGAAVDLVATMWRAEDGSDALLALAALAGIALGGLTGAARLTGRLPASARDLGVGTAAAFAVTLWLVFIRVIEPPEGAATELRWGALAALALAALALTCSVVATLAARATPGGSPGDGDLASDP